MTVQQLIEQLMLLNPHAEALVMWEEGNIVFKVIQAYDAADDPIAGPLACIDVVGGPLGLTRP